MKLAATAAVAALLLAGCASEPADPWIAYASTAADAQAGASAEIAAHYSLGEECAVSAPVLEIVEPGALGVASLGSVARTFSAPDAPCDGTEAQASAVFYDAAAGVSGVDTVVYRELTGGARPDVVHTVSVRVR
ncbi:hypothetical protein [Rubrimonas cliftonensis]|uniref:Lipoprotein n=1 Tax=Rubrimonas cliftonensis TaxID=89524 RepID=A0A1H4D963_9RHOB|nr:hypothetical protein [Rubrimonas cliftonensis]SEA69010.1 hypothetical protein SAMN05444370_10998 [Rubrimonas cliftonensis]